MERGQETHHMQNHEEENEPEITCAGFIEHTDPGLAAWARRVTSTDDIRMAIAWGRLQALYELGEISRDYDEDPPLERLMAIWLAGYRATARRRNSSRLRYILEHARNESQDEERELVLEQAFETLDQLYLDAETVDEKAIAIADRSYVLEGVHQYLREHPSSLIEALAQRHQQRIEDDAHTLIVLSPESFRTPKHATPCGDDATDQQHNLGNSAEGETNQ